MARARVQHLSEGRLFSAQNLGLGLFLAGEHSFAICSTGSNVLKTCDFRGHVKFKLLTNSEDLVFLGNCTTKPCWYERCAESSWLLSGSNHECRQKKIDGLFWSVIIKFCNNEIVGIYKHYLTTLFKSVVVQQQRQQILCWTSLVRIPVDTCIPHTRLFLKWHFFTSSKIQDIRAVGRTLHSMVSASISTHYSTFTLPLAVILNYSKYIREFFWEFADSESNFCSLIESLIVMTSSHREALQGAVASGCPGGPPRGIERLKVEWLYTGLRSKSQPISHQRYLMWPFTISF